MRQPPQEAGVRSAVRTAEENVWDNRHSHVYGPEQSNPSDEDPSHGVVGQEEEVDKASEEKKYGCVKQQRDGLYRLPHAKIFHPGEKEGAYSRTLVGHIMEV